MSDNKKYVLNKVLRIFSVLLKVFSFLISSKNASKSVFTKETSIFIKKRKILVYAQGWAFCGDFSCEIKGLTLQEMLILKHFWSLDYAYICDWQTKMGEQATQASSGNLCSEPENFCLEPENVQENRKKIEGSGSTKIKNNSRNYCSAIFVCQSQI